MSEAAIKIPEQGIIEHFSAVDYHKVEAMHSSAFKQLSKSPAHFMENKLNPRETTASQGFGTAFHSLVLEPKIFSEIYAIGPKGIEDRRKKEWLEFAKANEGKILLKSEEHERLTRMRDAVMSHKVASKLLTGGFAEQSFFWKDPVSRVFCKCRPDYLRHDNIIIDLKSSQDASPEAFRRSIGDWFYHVQSCFYLEGVGAVKGKLLTDFVHIVVETDSPHGVGLYTLDDQSLAMASDKIRKLLEVYSNCVKTGIWPAYTEDIQNISVPPWVA